MKVNKIINEAFSPSMPKWLSGYIMTTMPGKFGSDKVLPISDKKKDSYRQHGVTVDFVTPEHGRGRNNGNFISSKDAWRELFQRDIDYSRAEFVNVPIDKSLDKNDFYRKDRLYFIYLSCNGDNYLWMPGVNDTDYFYRPRKDGGMQRVFLADLNEKNLRDYAKGICYIDLTKPYQDRELRDARASLAGSIDYSQERSPLGSSSKESPIKLAQKSFLNGRPTDKSGYIIVPSKIKYADELKKNKYKGVGKQLGQLYREMVGLKSNVDEIYNSVDFDNVGDSSNLANVMSEYASTFSLYNSIMKKLERTLALKAQGQISEYDFDRNMEYLVEHDILDIKWAIKQVKKLIEKNITTYMDWDDIPEEED